MKQMPMFSGNWISGNAAMPEPGQRVLEIYETDDGKLSNPVTGTPIHTDGTHIINGKSIYRRTVWWMPIPPAPCTKDLSE